MNLLSCGIVIFCCTFIGYRLGIKYKEKRILYYDLYCFCTAYHTNLQYRRLPICKLLCDKRYGKLFENYKKGFLEERVYLSANSKEEDKYISDFFAVLGKSDALSQQKEIEFYKQYFSEKLADATKQCKEKGELCKRLGVLCGILLCILFI